MIQIQVVPREGVDAFKLLRSKVLHEATTWYWANKAKTRLRHIQSEGHIEVSNAGGVVAARVFPKEPRDVFYLAEKFMGRLVAWFQLELAAINVQFVEEPETPRRKRSVKRKKKTVGRKKRR
ncbi:MAG: hypothetical protein OER90_12900 [Gemmatimonadota bacterium]|nr:hypothetical protein [Gemmatimonadota bacterium]